METKARYVRISHQTQNEARHKLNKFDGVTYIDICSCTIPFSERPKGKLLCQAIKSGKVNYAKLIRLIDADVMHMTYKLQSN